MTDSDLFTLIDLLFNKAITDVLLLDDQSKRTISFQVRQRNAMVSIHLEYFSPVEHINASTDSDAVLDLIIQKYEGTFVHDSEGGISRTNVLFPIP